MTGEPKLPDFGILFELLVYSGAAFTGANGPKCPAVAGVRHRNIDDCLTPNAASLLKFSLSQLWHVLRVNGQGEIAGECSAALTGLLQTPHQHVAVWKGDEFDRTIKHTLHKLRLSNGPSPNSSSARGR